ncbi:MAG: hypothetical protein NTY92_02575 [Nitrosospira sp.]|nr:hypothetical protein [Nitrosospira sp.]
MTRRDAGVSRVGLSAPRITQSPREPVRVARPRIGDVPVPGKTVANSLPAR